MLAALGVLLLFGFAILWFNRVDLADDYARQELERLDVEAAFEIDDIGFDKQIIRNLVLGDPENPDLTAELVEIGNSVSTDGAGVNWVRASGVKLFARYVNGKLSLGELEKFMDPDDDSPLALPDIWLGLDKAQMRIESDYGVVGLSLNGEGNLKDGFKGKLAAISREIDLGSCLISEPTLFADISISIGQPRMRGPLRLPDVKCDEAGFAAENMASRLNLRLGKDLASWEGSLGTIGGPLRQAGNSAQEIRSSLDFSGDMEQSKGVIKLTASGVAMPLGGAETAELDGLFTAEYGGDEITTSFRGDPVIRKARLSADMLRSINNGAGSLDGTPVGPVAGSIADAIRQAGGAMDIAGTVRFSSGNRGVRLTLNSLDVQSRSGAELTLDDPLLLDFTPDGLAILADGTVSLKGGGLPNSRLTLFDGSVSDGFAGQLQMASYTAEDARLTVPEMRFFPTGNGGTAIDGRILLSGPLADGRLTGLQVPINARIDRNGNYALFRKCVDVRFASLKLSTLEAGPTRATLCPDASTAIVRSGRSGPEVAARTTGLDLTARVGDSPLNLSGGRFGYTTRNGLMAQDVAIRFGVPGNVSKMEIGEFTMTLGESLTGRISGASGQVANVPLLLENIDGEWSYEGGAFKADTGLRVRDEEQVERFRPLISNDAKIIFANGMITATGILREPETQREITTVDMRHSLDNSTGAALLDVGWLTFDDELQPEMLTPLTLGIVANVQGTITGSGRINWDQSGDGVRSIGEFATRGLDLAAAFGPVTGLKGNIRFSDLLGLETEPGQTVRMAEVNPGVPAFNGVLSYRLLPDRKMEVEGGQWPFAGGMLYLEPTVFDLGEEAERRLEFTVVGVDAAQFLTKFEFENLSATGIFDGQLPMVFDQDGGRIVGGYLEARRGGGTLAYIGELTYEDMGTMANYAFNALKSIKYRNLTIGMEGAIDGEIITEVKFAGLQQGDDASRNFITKQLAQIPIEFNVRIQAPFMQLMSSAKAFYEPEILVGQNLPALLRAQEARARAAAKQLEDNDE
ncbi:YdbH domain-containing protein [Parasphingorhabdus marina]|uniref:YdbH domain-containing protein n=1 Tax=Parasphingorhabdus marina TaxID=394732 RepID=UPI001EF5333D|nr:YdbH domain-containing protein [Parasphingorhabdus marina]